MQTKFCRNFEHHINCRAGLIYRAFCCAARHLWAQSDVRSCGLWALLHTTEHIYHTNSYSYLRQRFVTNGKCLRGKQRPPSTLAGKRGTFSTNFVFSVRSAPRKRKRTKYTRMYSTLQGPYFMTNIACDLVPPLRYVQAR
jgi:hypothetical protein